MKLNGINLGGWLILEKWITPSVFDGTNAWDYKNLAQIPDKRKTILQHYKNFITETDFRWIKNHNLNAIRLPIGFWAFGEHPFLVEHKEQIDFCIAMCNKYDLKLILSFHGMKGSQNGKLHSGKNGKIEWLSKPNQKYNLNFLAKLANTYKNQKCLYGIEITNEPEFFELPIVKRVISIFKAIIFYKKAYKILNKITPNKKVIISDGFLPEIFKFLLPKNSVMDIHLYQTFSDKHQNLTFAKHISLALTRQKFIKKLQKYRKVMIGEWSNVLPNLNLSNKKIQKYYDTQKKSMHNAIGFFYWTYKTENDHDLWNFKKLVDNKILKP